VGFRLLVLLFLCYGHAFTLLELSVILLTLCFVGLFFMLLIRYLGGLWVFMICLLDIWVVCILIGFVKFGENRGCGVFQKFGVGRGVLQN